MSQSALAIDAHRTHRCSQGGIGHALAREFHSRGLLVFATARSVEKMQDLMSVPGIDCIRLDVSDAESVSACFREMESRLDGKGLDYLVNNAGGSERFLFFSFSSRVSCLFSTRVVANKGY